MVDARPQITIARQMWRFRHEVENMKQVFKWLTAPAVVVPVLRILLAVGAAWLAGLSPDVAAAAAVAGELATRPSGS